MDESKVLIRSYTEFDLLHSTLLIIVNFDRSLDLWLTSMVLEFATGI